MPVERLKKRREFLKVAASGRVAASKTVVVQALFSESCDSLADKSRHRVRVGFTASRRVGGAVIRNRAKRRLRALIDSHLLPVKKKPVDIVLIARHSTTVVPFATLKSDFLKSLSRLGIKG